MNSITIVYEYSYVLVTIIIINAHTPTHCKNI